MNKKQMIASGATELEIANESIEALFEVIESLPVDLHDMDCHFWCDDDDDDEEDE